MSGLRDGVFGEAAEDVGDLLMMEQVYRELGREAGKECIGELHSTTKRREVTRWNSTWVVALLMRCMKR